MKEILSKDELGTRNETMSFIADKAESIVNKYTKKIDTYWQPSTKGLLPDFSDIDESLAQVEIIQSEMKRIPRIHQAVLIADTITEEGITVYNSWLSVLDGGSTMSNTIWSKWTSKWTSEENRHANILERLLYLSGSFNLVEIEKTVQLFIQNGIDIGTGSDPYRNFIYTSIQEAATELSHKRLGDIVKKEFGCEIVSKISNLISGDENRHCKIYKGFCGLIVKEDPSGLLIAFADMMKKKIVMPNHNMMFSNGILGDAYKVLDRSAQILGVYTTADYSTLISDFVKELGLLKLSGISDEASKAQSYIGKLLPILNKYGVRSAEKYSKENSINLDHVPWFK